MVALGLVLLILSVLFAVGIVGSNGAPLDASAFGVSLSNVSIGGLFLAGLITGLVGALGLFLLLGGAARRRNRRVRTKREVTNARTEADDLAERNARLEEQLERERSASLPPKEGERSSRSGAAGDSGRHDRPGPGA